MNRLMATNTTPVTQKVMAIVVSMVFQFDAIGVKYQGLRKWNRTEPSARTISAMAIGMSGFHGGSLQPPVQQGRHDAEDHVRGQGLTATQVGQPREEAREAFEIDHVQNDAQHRPR